MSRLGGCLSSGRVQDSAGRGEDMPWSYNPTYKPISSNTSPQHTRFYHDAPPSPTPSYRSQTNVLYNSGAAESYPNAREYQQDYNMEHTPSGSHMYLNQTFDIPQQMQYEDNSLAQATASGGSHVLATDAENRCSCVYMVFENFRWEKQQHYAVVRDGREYFDRYVVTYRLPNSNVEYDMFTHSEGLVHAGPIESKFPNLCGEMLSFHALPPVNSLQQVCYYVPPLIDPNAPYHVQEEVCKSNILTPVSLPINTKHQVMVFRTYNDTLALQLMPTAFSERPIVTGTPLFHGVRKNICATVGSTFSEFHYVINGSPCMYALFSIGTKEKNESSDADRMRVIVLDRRDRVDSEEWTANETVMNSVSDVALPVLQRFEGKHARLDVRDILYVGVVSSTLQLTDAPSVSKKYKPPKNALVAVIDNRGVYAVQLKDKEIVSQWVQKDSNVTYSILPRHFFDKPRTSIVRINTADTNAKLKRAKSREVLI